MDQIAGVVVACPSCGARLVAVSSQPPIRLICAQCARPLPIKPGLPPYLWLQLNARRWFLLLVLLVLPLLVLTLSPGTGSRSPRADQRPRLARTTTGLVRQQRNAQQSALERRRQRP